MSKQAIAIFSGGMDSVTLLHYLKDAEYKIYGLSFDYGQKHKKELEFAQYWAKKICVDWLKVDISFMKAISSHSALTNPEIKMPHEHYTDKNQQITVVPNRNMVMISIAVAWAENLGISEVFFGPHSNDRAIYPDCRAEFVEALNQATMLATYNHVEVKAPFAHISKSEIALLGQKLHVDYSQTWSCYEGGKKHCGVCATCQERKEAFQKANMPDPTEYEK